MCKGFGYRLRIISSRLLASASLAPCFWRVVLFPQQTEKTRNQLQRRTRVTVCQPVQLMMPSYMPKASKRPHIYFVYAKSLEILGCAKLLNHRLGRTPARPSFERTGWRCIDNFNHIMHTIYPYTRASLLLLISCLDCKPV